SGSLSFSDGSSPISTTTYIGDVMVGNRSLSQPYAYNCQRGLFFPHGRSSVTESMSVSVHGTDLRHLERLRMRDKSTATPWLSRPPAGAPSAKVERLAPLRTASTSRTDAKSAIARSAAASAA